MLESGFLDGFVDWHCHILPGVDDGVREIEESFKILKEYEQAGVRQIWFTPHIMSDVPNTTEGLTKHLEDFKSAYDGNIELHLAAEYMVDDLFVERFNAGDILYLGPEKNSILVETSFYSPAVYFKDVVRNIIAKGYYPVLAHPERYIYADDKYYDQLKSMGVKFQLNLPSLAGMYGKAAQKKAVNLLKKGYYNYSGTDTHRYNQLVGCITTKISEKEIGMIYK